MKPPWRRQRASLPRWVPLRRALPRVWAAPAVRPLHSHAQRQLKACSAIAAIAGGGGSGPSGGDAAWAVGAGAAGGLPRLAEWWERRRQEVAAFRELHGRIPREAGGKAEALTEEERQLGAWCTRQRQRKKGNIGPPLTPEQEASLEAIPGWYWDGKAVSHCELSCACQ